MSIGLRKKKNGFFVRPFVAKGFFSGTGRLLGSCCSYQNPFHGTERLSKFTTQG